MAPSCDGLDRLQRLGRVDEVLQVAAEDAGLLDRVEHAPRLVGGRDRAAWSRAPPCRPRATAVTASSCRKFGSATTTTSVSGCSMAACRSVVDSGTPWRAWNASPRSADREYTTRTRSRAALAVEGHRVEVADEPRAEHGHVVLLHSLSSLRGARRDRACRGRDGAAARGPAAADAQACRSAASTGCTVPAVGRTVDSWPSSQATR